LFLGGCVIALVREGLSDRNASLERSSVDIIELVVRTYGSDEGPISLSLFISEPGLLLSNSEVEGWTGRASLTVMGSDTFHIHFPDRESFHTADEASSRAERRVVPVSLGDGSVVPGVLEVVVLG
jgi:hypothetical protein